MEQLNHHFRQQDDDRIGGHFGCHQFAPDAATLPHALRRAGFGALEELSWDPSMFAAHNQGGSLYMLARR